MWSVSTERRREKTRVHDHCTIQHAPQSHMNGCCNFARPVCWWQFCPIPFHGFLSCTLDHHSETMIAVSISYIIIHQPPLSIDRSIVRVDLVSSFRRRMELNWNKLQQRNIFNFNYIYRRVPCFNCVAVILLWQIAIEGGRNKKTDVIMELKNWNATIYGWSKIK